MSYKEVMRDYEKVKQKKELFNCWVCEKDIEGSDEFIDHINEIHRINKMSRIKRLIHRLVKRYHPYKVTEKDRQKFLKDFKVRGVR